MLFSLSSNACSVVTPAHTLSHFRIRASSQWSLYPANASASVSAIACFGTSISIHTTAHGILWCEPFQRVQSLYMHHA